MHLIGALLIAAIIGAVAVSYLGRVTGRVADHGTPGAQRVARGSRRAASNGRQRAQHGVAEIWAEVRAADWLERKRNARVARRAAGRAAGRGAMATARGVGRGARAAGRGTARGLGALRARAQATGQPPDPTLSAAPPAPRPDAPRPERAPVPMTTPTSGSAPASAGGADLFTAIQQVTSHAMSGGLRSKQRSFKTLEDGLDYMSQQVAMFARQLSEPGQEYPASIWEPLAKAAAHLKAAASAAGESSSGIGALAGMNLGEAADSSVHVPHNTQLNAPR
jgi:hypothetical protein